MRRGVIGSDVARALEIVRNGGLVGLPTETVYGLAADASQKEAVAKVFTVKGRPNNHPLIVHVSTLDVARTWSSQWTHSAELLGSTYWPGPLSIIVQKSSVVLNEVTGGHQTVAVRVPGHELALELLQQFGGGLAAPSANKFGKVSPTTAQHVLHDLGDGVDYILDGGPCRVGVESTIVDCSLELPLVLRPGGITSEAIESLVALDNSDSGVSRAPGMLMAHYAPLCEVVLVAKMQDAEGLVGEANSKHRILDASIDPTSFASAMYSLLRQCDLDGIQRLFVVQPAPIGIGLAIRDRLTKAAHGSKNRSR
ncbi:MAG: L-threonylcarbamoyladenylate synthase [Actinomycetota bacterium]|nr:L-threonylcarbamoyladenylate synthase [Actinomycetota bacterium]MDA3020902.1 L-threonylcarbamoyladenylate synthase [Actinomycetota bacterium]